MLPNREVFRHWREYFSIGVPVMVMLGAEYVGFEILNFSSGYIGVPTQAA